MRDPTPSADFVSVVDLVRHEVSSTVHGAGQPEAAYLVTDARLEEAAVVAPCASRFASAEILPDDPRHPVGRYVTGALGLSPSLGRVLRKRLVRAGEEVGAALRDLVVDALAFAYVAAIDAEGAHINAGGDPMDLAVRMDRTPEQIWNYWVVSFAGDPGQAFDTRFRRNIQDICLQRVTSRLRELDLLPPIGRRTKLAATAGTYATAGLLLRMSQSNNLTDDAFAGSWRWASTMWPYEDYSE